ncbi:IPT/TIG domain-containing protein [Raineyella fluvialis]|uniref:Cutinase family protein n=1 Tax=Raineyella fluvialis TaxID=2662261 RepID=A0A5Q2FFQ5_9ACTN|nr:IPT/TIG domain-containing protein [Raineyella fluvialis]QGF23126.1 cutinase family protein [Raineyella fluvialis]
MERIFKAVLTSLLAVALFLPGSVGTAITSASAAPGATIPVVGSLSPSTGSTSGGVLVTITGTGLTGATSVMFGKTAGTQISVISDTSLSVLSPAASAGTVDVRVTTPGGTSQKSKADSFTFVPAPVPTVGSLSPSTGSTSGGVLVTITGTGLTGATSVMFGKTAGTQISVISDTSLSVLSPAASAGTVDVRVTTPGGTSQKSKADSFTFVPAPVPTVGSLSPSTGSTSGGVLVTITGTGLTGATAVMFGTVAATNVVVVSDTQLTATSPAMKTAGGIDITVTTPGGTTATTPTDRFTFADVPTLTQVSPAAGPTAGGTTVTITGTGLTGATAVMFGTVAATNVVVVSDTQLTATSPAMKTAGGIDITVTTPGGTTATTPTDRFTFADVPTLTQVSPAAGPTAGGTTVTITGTGLTGATAVMFGTVAATNVVVVSDTQLTATSPAMKTAGGIDITVTTPGGTTATTPTDRFTFADVPTLTQVSPAAGPTAGGTTVTITGTGLTGATAVMFGTVAATNVVVVSDTQLTATSPAMKTAGGIDITVTTPGGTTATTPTDRFTFADVPTLTQVSPAAGPTAGGTTVTITGTGLTGATAVMFGTVAATNVVVVSDTQLTATSPAMKTAGGIDITVTTPGGTTATTPTDRFTFESACGSTYSQFVDVYGAITSNTDWGPECANVYVLHGIVGVAPGVQLTLEPGSLIEANSDGSLQVGGTLTISGNGASPVVVTSTGDASGGQPIPNVAYPPPASTTWGGVNVLAGGVARVSGASIRYASYNGLSVANGGSADVTGSQFISNGTGISFDPGSSGSVTGDQFTGGTTGLVVTDGANVTIDADSFTAMQTGISLSNPATIVSNCTFDTINADTIKVSTSSPFDPAKITQGNTATNSPINGVHLKDPVFADGATLFGRPGWGLVLSNASGSTVNVPAGSSVTVPAGAVIKFQFLDHWPFGADRGVLAVAGVLNVNGTLTKLNDDTAGGPISTTVTYTDSYYGSHFQSVDVLAGGVARVSGASIRYASYNGLSVANGGSADVTGSQFISNGTGISFDPGSSGSVTGDQFTGGTTGLVVTDGANVTIDADSFTAMQTGISLSNPATIVSNCTFDTINADTIKVSTSSPFDPAKITQGNTATNSPINGVHLKDPVFADGATLFGRPGWGLVLSNASGSTVNVPAGSSVTVPAGAVIKFQFLDHWPFGADRGVLAVAGVLNVNGTLTKLNDDTAGGPISTTVTYTDSYYGSHFQSVDVLAGGVARVSAASIRYANNGLNVASGGSAEVTGSQFINNGTAVTVAGVLEATGVDVRNTGTGIKAVSASRTLFRGSFTQVNTGISADDSSYVDARDVNWGAASGPAPTGAGAAAIGPVLYYPWSGYTAPVVAPIAATTNVPNVSTCSNILAFGLRGSGELPQWSGQVDNGLEAAYFSTWEEGMGKPGQTAYDAYKSVAQAKDPSLTIEQIGVRYEAKPVAVLPWEFQHSIDDGVAKTLQYLRDAHDRCGYAGQRYVLIGYSQGAAVIHKALTQLTPEELDLIQGVILVGDAGRQPDAREHLFEGLDASGNLKVAGWWVAGANGMLALQTQGIPDSLTSKTYSLCHAGDPICTMTPTNGMGVWLQMALQWPSHTGYSEPELAALTEEMFRSY